MTKYDPHKHHRRSVRLKEFDYSQPGYYFVPICVQNRDCLFGECANSAMQLNAAGEMVVGMLLVWKQDSLHPEAPPNAFNTDQAKLR